MIWGITIHGRKGREGGRTGEREKLGCDGASTEASTLRSFIAARVAGSRQGLYFSAVSWGSQGRGQDFGEAAVYSGGDAREGSEGNTPGSWRTAACISERDLNGHPSVQHRSIGDTACDHRGWAGLPVRGLETRTERHRQTEPGGGGFVDMNKPEPSSSSMGSRLKAAGLLQTPWSVRSPIDTVCRLG